MSHQIFIKVNNFRTLPMVQDDMAIRPLSEALRKKAEEELNETPEKIVSQLKILQDWIKTEPDLQTMKTPNQWLIAFLRGCKFDMEKTKEKLKMYAAYKTNLPEFYGNRDPFDPDIQEILKMGVTLPLRNTMSDDDAPRMCLYRTGYYSLTKRPLKDLLRVSLMIFEILMLEDDNFVVAGKGSLNDLLGMGFGFMLQVTPSLAKKTLTCIEKTLSIRIKSIQVLNPPYGLSVVLAVIKMFLKSKAINRILIHSKTSLYDHVDKYILPKEYGGTNGTLQELTDYWKAKVESYRDWFVDENTCNTRH